MAKRNETMIATADREIVIRRRINAPRELVFKAWTDPKHLVEWWGPKGFTNTFHEIDVRPGGVWRFIMHSPDGIDYPNKIVYDKIVEPGRIEYTHSSDAENDLHQFRATVTFEDKGNKTDITMHALFATTEEYDKHVEFGAIQGGNSTLDCLEEHLIKMAAEEELIISRVFNASRELVFKVWTEPEHLMHWWGPKGFTMRAARVDLRPGGIFHYALKSPAGHEMWGRFVYREISAPERLAFVISFSDSEGNITRHPLSETWPLEVLNTITLTEQDGKTTFVLRAGPINATGTERRTFLDGFKSMQQGFKGTMDQLDEYLLNLSPHK